MEVVEFLLKEGAFIDTANKEGVSKGKGLIEYLHIYIICIGGDIYR